MLISCKSIDVARGGTGTDSCMCSSNYVTTKAMYNKHKRFLTQGSENIKLYTGYAGYSKRFGVLHHNQLNMIDLYESIVMNLL